MRVGLPTQRKSNLKSLTLWEPFYGSHEENGSIKILNNINRSAQKVYGIVRKVDVCVGLLGSTLETKRSSETICQNFPLWTYGDYFFTFSKNPDKKEPFLVILTT